MTKFKFNDKQIGLFTWTEDMQAFSFSLPAYESCPHKVANDKDDICSGCYAVQNRYNMPNVMGAQYNRLFWLKEQLKIDFNGLVKVFDNAIKSDVKNGFFRGHDSGDFFHQKYIDMWFEVCKLNPKVKFWFPCRGWWTSSVVWQEKLRNLSSLKNVSLRPSAIKYDQPAPRVKGYSAGTAVVLKENHGLKKTSLCPKTLNGGSCESNKCRSCWSKRGNIAYLIHGRFGKSMPSQPSAKELGNRQRMKESLIKLTISAKTILQETKNDRRTSQNFQNS